MRHLLRPNKFQERTEWYNIVVWRRLAKIVGEYVSKGSQLYMEGKLQTTSKGRPAKRRKEYRTEIVASDLVLMNSREKGNGVQSPRSDQAEKQKSTQLAGARAAELESDVPF